MSAPADQETSDPSPPGQSSSDQLTADQLTADQPTSDQPTSDQPTADESAADREALDPHCLTVEQADAMLAGSPWTRFAVLGDSLAEGLGDEVPGYRDRSWADRVAAALERQRPAEFAYLNLGRRDLFTEQVRATQLQPALDFQPDLVLLVAGGSDIARRGFGEGEDVQADCDAIVAALRAAGAEVVTATIFDVTTSPLVPDERKAPLRRRLEDLAARIRAVAAAHGTLHADLAAHPAAGDRDIYSADLRHANRRGHAIAAAGVIRRLGERLGNRVD